jgi:uncharacterized RDD family membrane protein YckC
MTAMVSGEGVALDLARAGLGTRTVAAVIDLILQLVILLAFAALDAAIGPSDPAMVAAVVVIELVVVLAGYPILFEWLTRGRTPGKMALGLRVVRDDGGPIGFRQALVRGLAAFLIEKPGLIAPVGIALGIGSLAFGSSSKRIGDLLAGTFVISERAGDAHSLAAPAFPVPPALQGWAVSLDLSRVDDELAFRLRQFVLRAPRLNAHAVQALEKDFRHRVLSAIAPPPPPGVPTSVLLMTVLAERRRRYELMEQALLSAAGRSVHRPWHTSPVVVRPGPAVTPGPVVKSGPAAAQTGPYTPPS